MMHTFVPISFLLLAGVVIFVLLAFRALYNLGEGRGIGPKRRSGAVQIGPLPRPGKPNTLASAATPGDGRICPYELCRAPNNLQAHFCRRCGRELAPLEQPRPRRVAS